MIIYLMLKHTQQLNHSNSSISGIVFFHHNVWWYSEGGGISKYTTLCLSSFSLRFLKIYANVQPIS